MYLFSFILILANVVSLAAQEPDGYAIMQRALSKSSWQDLTADMQLILRNSRGEERVREIAFYSSDGADGLSRMLMRFKAPADVRGTGFLTLETPSGDDERYLYLPALRRVKKIAASGRGGNFMSSDFTYYDIGKPKLDDWTYTLLSDTTIAGRLCYRIECRPASPKTLDDTGYGKIVRYLDKATLNAIRSDYYDKGLNKWKELEVVQYTTIMGVDFATDMIMHDLQIDHTSEIRFTNLKVNTGLPDQFFTVRFLQRGR
jgi:outer membrane lipoprotein-sorting protein